MEQAAEPTTPTGWFERARTLHATGDPRGAVRAYRRVLAQVPDSVSTLTNLAVVLAQLNHLDEAWDALETAHHLAPDDLAVLANLGEVGRLLGRHEIATVFARAALDRAPEDPDAKMLLANLLLAQDRPADAEALLLEVLARRPGHEATSILLSDAVRAQGRPEAALAPLEAAFAAGGRSVSLLNGLVMTRFDTGDVAGAIAAGEMLLRRKDADVMAGFAPHREALALDRAALGRRGRDVISFSLFGANPVYTQGAIDNVRLAGVHYPGWICRFYCDATVPADIRAQLVADGAEVVLVVDPPWTGLHGAVWRYAVADDPTVHRYVSRDCDNRICAQERWAVDRWIDSGRAFHLMRDHPYHAELIMANMWGGHAGVLPAMTELLRRFPQRRTDRWSDQNFAAAAIWPLIRDDVLIHDSHWDLFASVQFDPAVMLPRPDHVGASFRELPAPR